MRKIAFLYPGQGAQTAGMGRDFYEHSAVAKAMFEEASELLAIRLPELCFTKNELLDRTDYTQAALLVTCMAMTEEIRRHGLLPDITAGLSLGEYTAICAAGGMTFQDAVKTVWLRGNLMHKADPQGRGGMAAVLGLDGDRVREVTEPMEGVSVANYNCPGQIVITGQKTALETAATALKAAGAKRVLPVKVSGPFHSPYMKIAGDRLGEQLRQIPWKKPAVPYVTNVNAKVVTDTAETAALLQEQVSSPVLWEQSVRTMQDWGADCFIEIGPGRTLSRFMARIDKAAQIHAIGTMEEMYQVLETLKQDIERK